MPCKYLSTKGPQSQEAEGVRSANAHLSTTLRSTNTNRHTTSCDRLDWKSMVHLPGVFKRKQVPPSCLSFYLCVRRITNPTVPRALETNTPSLAPPLPHRKAALSVQQDPTSIPLPQPWLLDRTRPASQRGTKPRYASVPNCTKPPMPSLARRGTENKTFPPRSF